MLVVRTDKPQFEYDIRSLVKAFYPQEEIKIIGNEEVDLPIFLTISFEAEKIVLVGGETKDEYGHILRSEVKHSASEERTEIKNLLKQLLYQYLKKECGQELLWGTLTGIRPTKIAMAMLEEGLSDTEALDKLKQIYYISDEKGRLSVEIARREQVILSALHYEEGYSIYIGIPFCPTTCLYCSFTSYPISLWTNRVGQYLEALEKEMAHLARLYKDKVVDTIYIGGGTPTTLSAVELEQLFCMVEKYFEVEKLLEYTVEAGRADSITRDKLKVMKHHHISRISVNPQTMKQETLEIIGRKHTVEQVKEAFFLAREEGFDNINMDIILGLPGESKEDVAHTLSEIALLHPDSLTVHSLAIKRASGLNKWIEENGVSTINNTDETMDMAAEAARKMGMVPYYLYRQKNMSGNLENVGYASPGKHGIYNILIMEEMQTIAALGAGGISKVVYPDGRIERDDNVKDVALYIERIKEMIERKERLLGNPKI